MPAPLILVNLPTGLLGSDKTRVLKQLVRGSELAPTLVIIKQCGKVRFDHLLLSRPPDATNVEASGGCRCCTILARHWTVRTDWNRCRNGTGMNNPRRTTTKNMGMATATDIAGSRDLAGLVLLAVTSAMALPRLMPRLLRARLLPQDEMANELRAWP